MVHTVYFPNISCLIKLKYITLKHRQTFFFPSFSPHIHTVHLDIINVIYSPTNTQVIVLKKY